MNPDWASSVNMRSFTSSSVIEAYAETVFPASKTITDSTPTVTEDAILAMFVHVGVVPSVEEYIYYIRVTSGDFIYPIEIFEP